MLCNSSLLQFIYKLRIVQERGKRRYLYSVPIHEILFWMEQMDEHPSFFRIYPSIWLFSIYPIVIPILTRHRFPLLLLLLFFPLLPFILISASSLGYLPSISNGAETHEGKGRREGEGREGKENERLLAISSLFECSLDLLQWIISVSSMIHFKMNRLLQRSVSLSLSFFPHSKCKSCSMFCSHPSVHFPLS